MNKVLVIGLGISGRSAAQFLINHGYSVVGVDQNKEVFSHPQIEELLIQGLITIHANEDLAIDEFDFVVVSPGVPPTDRFYASAKAKGIEVIGEVELACRHIKSKMVGITGTNGKTTVTLLVTHVLNKSGFPARALGNSGVPITSECVNNNEIIVAELSSFQLETLHRRVLDAAVLLNVTPDHLDRYDGMEGYAAAKLHIVNCLKDNAPFFIENTCFQEFGYLFKYDHIKKYGYTKECDLYTDLHSLFFGKHLQSQLPKDLLGRKSHDIENLMAAFGLCVSLGVSPQQFYNAVLTFKKPPHRIEKVRELKGITYIDDSKGTNIDAVMRAVETMPGNVILIAGGVDKGAAYTPWIDSFKNKVKLICAIGQAAPKIQKDLSHAIPVKLCATLEHAVDLASAEGKTGDVVLLSPGCSSFDMFRDYAHRGQEFQRIVNSRR